MRPEAVEAMVALLDNPLGNPTGTHRGAREARKVIDEARDTMAGALGCLPGEVIFTGGGTEADNLAVRGYLAALARSATEHSVILCSAIEHSVILCSAIEHHAVLDPVVALGGSTVAVDAHGRLDLADLEARLSEESVGLVSVMLANNEIGVVQDLAAVAEVIDRVAPQVVLHTDAVQAFPWLDVSELAAPAQLVSISAHKFGGPQGVGALVVRGGLELEPLLMGGGQERGRRSGTHNVAGIGAMAAAAAAVVSERTATVSRVGALRDRLADRLLAELPGVIETAVPTGSDGRPDRSHKVAGSCHLLIDGVESEALLFLLDQAGVAASAASSCSSGAMESSHVLAAIGIPPEQARSSLRLSLGATTTEAEVDHAVTAIVDAVTRLRRHS